MGDGAVVPARALWDAQDELSDVCDQLVQMTVERTFYKERSEQLGLALMDATAAFDGLHATVQAHGDCPADMLEASIRRFANHARAAVGLADRG